MCDHTPFLAGCIRGFPTCVPWLHVGIACMTAAVADNMSVIALIKDDSSAGIQETVRANLSAQALIYVDQSNRRWLMYPFVVIEGQPCGNYKRRQADKAQWWYLIL